MKAIQIFKYNKQDINATLVEIAKPTIQPDEVLVRIKAAGVNPLDNKITRGGVKMLVPPALHPLNLFTLIHRYLYTHSPLFGDK